MQTAIFGDLLKGEGEVVLGGKGMGGKGMSGESESVCEHWTGENESENENEIESDSATQTDGERNLSDSERGQAHGPSCCLLFGGAGVGGRGQQIRRGGEQRR